MSPVSCGVSGQTEPVISEVEETTGTKKFSVVGGDGKAGEGRAGWISDRSSP